MPIQVPGKTSLELGMAASTRMACPRMETADRFNQALPSTHHYRIGEGTLLLFDEEGREIMVLEKTDQEPHLQVLPGHMYFQLRKEKAPRL